MKNKIPDSNVIFTIENIKTLTYIKPTIKNPNIQVGEFSYFGDVNFICISVQRICKRK